MRKYHNKLVRDNIPEIIEASGNKCEIKTLTEQEFLQSLGLKLVEEAKEVAEASHDEIVKEIADVYEVIDNILLTLGIDRETVREKQQERRETRGGFNKKIELIWTED